MTILEGRADEKIIEKEMKHQFRGQEKWNIRKLSETKFLVAFPSTDMRMQLTKFKSFEFLTAPDEAGIKVGVEETDASTDATKHSGESMG